MYLGWGFSSAAHSEGRRANSGEGRSEKACKFSEAGTVEVPDFGSSGKAFQNY